MCGAVSIRLATGDQKRRVSVGSDAVGVGAGNKKMLHDGRMRFAVVQLTG